MTFRMLAMIVPADVKLTLGLTGSYCSVNCVSAEFVRAELATRMGAVFVAK